MLCAACIHIEYIETGLKSLQITKNNWKRPFEWIIMNLLMWKRATINLNHWKANPEIIARNQKSLYSRPNWFPLIIEYWKSCWALNRYISSLLIYRKLEVDFDVTGAWSFNLKFFVILSLGWSLRSTHTVPYNNKIIRNKM